MRIALNGYGRVGRCFVRALAQREATGWVAPFSLVAINDVLDAKDMLYLSLYYSIHGPFTGPVALSNRKLHNDQQRPKIIQLNAPSKLPYQEDKIKLVLTLMRE